MLGGRLFRHSMVNVGAAMLAAAAQLRADLYFMGVTGIHPEAGLTTGDAEEAAVKRALHERAAETVKALFQIAMIKLMARRISRYRDF